MRSSLGWLAIALAVGVVYSPAIHGGLIMDDAEHITPEAMRSLEGLWRIWFDVGATPHYYPVLNSVFWLQYHLWGANPVGYHLMNMVQQAAAAGMVFLIARRLQLPGAFFAGIIFAVHPVHVESVAWISEQKNTLSTLLALLASYRYLRFDATRAGTDYSVASILFLLALLTKTVVAVIPPAILVVLWWKRGRLEWRRDVLPLVSWFVVGAALGLFSAWFEQAHSNARGSTFELSFLTRVLIAGRAIWFYLRTLIWPQNLMFINPRWEISASAPIDYLGVAGVLCVAVILIYLARRWRGPLAAFLLYIGMLFPTLGLLNINWFNFSFVANHFQHLPSVGIIVPLAACFVSLLSRVGLPAGFRPGATGLVFLTFACAGYAHSRDYHSAEILYSRTVEKNPACWLAFNNLGVLLMEKEGEVEAAAAHFARAIALKPDHARAHNNYATALQRLGKVSEALDHYRRSLALQGGVPEVHVHYARALLASGGNPGEALAHFEEAVRLRPGYFDAEAGRAEVLAGWPGRRAEAVTAYQEVLKSHPNSVETLNNLAVLLAEEPSTRSDAISLLQRAVALAPDFIDSRFNLAVLLSTQPRQVEEARAHFLEILRRDPGNSDAQAALGRMRLLQQ